MGNWCGFAVLLSLVATTVNATTPCSSPGSFLLCEISELEYRDTAIIPAGHYAVCPIRLAAIESACTSATCRSTAAQLAFEYDSAKAEILNFYDDVCFGSSCFELPVTGLTPNAQPLSTGHTVAISPQTRGGWDSFAWVDPDTFESGSGGGALVAAHLSDPARSLSDSDVGGSIGGQLSGNPEVMRMILIPQSQWDPSVDPLRICLRSSTWANATSDSLFAQLDDMNATLVTALPALRTVGGSVSGLLGDNLIIQNNNDDDLSLENNGSFTFAVPRLDGSSYHVTVLSQPQDPSQSCSVVNGSGTVSGMHVTDIEVNCITDTYTVTTLAINGSMNPPLNPVVEHGQTTTITGNADDNHYFVSVSGCGGTLQSNADQSVTDFSYATGPITEPCTVEAVFAIRNYTIAASVTQGEGMINVLTPMVDHGSDAQFELAPGAGWSLSSFTGDTCTPIDNGDGSWTAANITDSCVSEAAFVENSFAELSVSRHPALIGVPVTYTIGISGSVSAPADGQVVLMSSGDGLVCLLDTPESSDGNTAWFSCQHTWTVAGSEALTASFSGSNSHGDSSAQVAQEIVADEFIFEDQFESGQ